MTRRIAIVLTLLLAVVPFGRAQDKPAPPKGERVFVCGHSFHAFIADPLAQLAKAGGIQGHELAGQQYLGGSRVQQHWDLADDKNALKKALKTGKVDVLTLSPHVKLPDEGIDKFTELALENNPNVRVLVQASWYPYDLSTNDAKTFKNRERDDAKIEDLRKTYEPFYAAILKQANDLNAKLKPKFDRQVVFVVPVGHAVVALREKVALGQVPGITKQSDLFLDGIGHGQVPIMVLASYCYYTAIYHRSPVGLSIPTLWSKQGKPTYDEKLDRILQEIAWEVVTSQPLSGVTAPTKK